MHGQQPGKVGGRCQVCPWSLAERAGREGSRLGEVDAAGLGKWVGESRGSLTHRNKQEGAPGPGFKRLCLIELEVIEGSSQVLMSLARSLIVLSLCPRQALFWVRETQ